MHEVRHKTSHQKCRLSNVSYTDAPGVVVSAETPVNYSSCKAGELRPAESGQLRYGRATFEGRKNVGLTQDMGPF